jgi:hypothetical protein
MDPHAQPPVTFFAMLNDPNGSLVVCAVDARKRVTALHVIGMLEESVSRDTHVPIETVRVPILMVTMHAVRG